VARREAVLWATEQMPQMREARCDAWSYGRPTSIASKKRGASTISSSQRSICPFLTSTRILPWPSTRVR
jgi:hypothetical protein